LIGDSLDLEGDRERERERERGKRGRKICPVGMMIALILKSRGE